MSDDEHDGLLSLLPRDYDEWNAALSEGICPACLHRLDPERVRRVERDGVLCVSVVCASCKAGYVLASWADGDE